MLSIDQILKSLNDLANAVDQDLAECVIQASHDSLGWDLRIVPERSDFCGLELSVTPHCFDITFDEQVTESDVPHEECDFSEVFLAVSMGDLEIRVERYRDLVLSRSLEVKLKSGEGFYSKHLGIWLPNFLRTCEVIQYKPFRKANDGN